MASGSSRRTRRRRAGSARPRAVASPRREQRAATRSAQLSADRRATRSLGKEGERPYGLFGAVPVSEAAILGGIIAAVVGVLGHSHSAIVIGLIICGLGAMEVAGREHFTGFRSHAALLAALPSIGLEAALVALLGDPRARWKLLAIVIPVFAVLFWTLRQRFAIARQARVAAGARGRAPRVS